MRLRGTDESGSNVMLDELEEKEVRTLVKGSTLLTIGSRRETIVAMPMAKSPPAVAVVSIESITPPVWANFWRFLLICSISICPTGAIRGGAEASGGGSSRLRLTKKFPTKLPPLALISSATTDKWKVITTRAKTRWRKDKLLFELHLSSRSVMVILLLPSGLSIPPLLLWKSWMVSSVAFESDGLRMLSVLNTPGQRSDVQVCSKVPRRWQISLDLALDGADAICYCNIKIRALKPVWFPF